MDGEHVPIQVKVEAFARNKAIQVTETCDDFPVLVRVTGAPWRRADEIALPRASMDVVVALSVRTHQVQEAVMMLVDRLSPNDQLSILFQRPFANGGHIIMELTYMSDHGRDVARLKISKLDQSHVDEKDEYVGPVWAQAAQVHPPIFTLSD
jgi:hypothetical protein